MGLKVTNNAYGTLNASITSSSTTIVLVAGQGARFPSLSAGDYFYATLIDTSNNLEIVKVTARSTDTLTVVRGQDSTTARAYATNDRFELRPTAALFTEVIDTANAALPKAGGVIASGGRIQFQTAEGNTHYGIRAVKYGYSSSYGALQIGDSSSPQQNISLGVDVSAIAGGAFNGSGKDITVPNNVQFWIPNSSNTNFILPMQFDTAGRVLTPLIPAFFARRTASQAGGVYIGDDVGLNNGSYYNSSNGRFTAPTNGIYLFSAAFLPNSSTGATGYIRKNGTRVSDTLYNLAADNYSSTVVHVQLVANDYVDFYIASDGTEGAYSHFGGHLLG